MDGHRLSFTSSTCFCVLFLCAGLGLWLALALKIKNLNGAFTHAAGAEIVVSARDE